MFDGLSFDLLSFDQDGLAAPEVDVSGGDLRERSRKIHDMPVALAKYRQVYDSIAALAPGPVV